MKPFLQQPLTTLGHVLDLGEQPVDEATRDKVSSSACYPQKGTLNSHKDSVDPFS